MHAALVFKNSVHNLKSHLQPIWWLKEQKTQLFLAMYLQYLEQNSEPFF
jgi:hypothetical protein